jgi:hypothetical protein
MSRWDFDYRPILYALADDACQDLLLATTGPADATSIAALLGSLSDLVLVEPVLDNHPLYWIRLRFGSPVSLAECNSRLRRAGVSIRYLVSATQGSQTLAAPLDLATRPPPQGSHWRTHGGTSYVERDTPGRWFLGKYGVNVVRGLCGTGARTRLAVIDNDAGAVEHLDLDDHITINNAPIARGSSHAAQLVAWAVRTAQRDGLGFVGVAPDASPRLYSIPKPGHEVFSLPLAIVRAVVDGADVILCATNVDGQWSPMLDDALTLATHMGRGGRGTAVVMPCSRETSSPEGSVHPSLSLGAGEPASDPRVFCIAPSGRDGGWFLWRDRSGRLHPFANRSPGLRWMAPGDDVALPFAGRETLAHAESSGASAVAAGVLLLLIGRNPDLDLAEVEQILTATTTPVAPAISAEKLSLVSRFEVSPSTCDRDGHNVKHGYGLVCATRACLAVSDPVCCALVTMGEDDAAMAWAELRQTSAPAAFYSNALGRWTARALLENASLRHAVCSLLRTLRLIAMRPDRLKSQSPGALVRLLAMAVRELAERSRTVECNEDVKRELHYALEHFQNLLAKPDEARAQEERLCEWTVALRSHDEVSHKTDRGPFSVGQLGA